jgi:hypothetical protein
MDRCVPRGRARNRRSSCVWRMRPLRSRGRGLHRRTVDQALERLATAPREHVENWDAEVDEDAHARRHPNRASRDEPPLLVWARAALRSGEVLEALRSRSNPPILAED